MVLQSIIHTEEDWPSMLIVRSLNPKVIHIFKLLKKLFNILARVVCYELAP